MPQWTLQDTRQIVLWHCTVMSTHRSTVAYADVHNCAYSMTHPSTVAYADVHNCAYSMTHPSTVAYADVHMYVMHRIVVSRTKWSNTTYFKGESPAEDR